ncbi:MAG: hypothetical protein CYPHOPRED_003283 [Cyphobasidiales sp. Tagirdzhanova-0007]|nr:MAG: hypothetical protein CYPHOPRED_003283 [Cyphobasidiales sp. Tagirdzhanova-0007]
MPSKRRVWQSDDWRADGIAAVGEFVGTFTFLLLGLGGIQAARTASEISGTSGGSMKVTVPSVDFLLMAATSMGAAFNPNIALMLMVLGVITPVRFVFYATAQMAGAVAAAAVLRGILPGPLLVNVSPSNEAYAEMFLTFGLCMTVIMLAVEKNKSTPLAPLAIGFALFSTQLAGINFTGAAVNTARAFGPAAATGDFVGSHWIYWVGPTLGALLAAGLYKGMLYVHWWELNPGADATKDEEAHYRKTAGIGKHAIAAHSLFDDRLIDIRTYILINV